MTRDLSPAEQKVLAALTDRIDAIVELATVPELTATTVLDGPGPAPDYRAFQRRFALLGRRMREVRFVVREDLPDTTGANTVIADGPPPAVREVQLRPSLVGPGTRTLTARALTLVHELAHSLPEGLTHPVKDYAYRTGWAWGHLPAELARNNADTYAEAAALLVERGERAWGRYQVLGRLAAQRGQLAKRANLTTLGAALAWLDITVNRAWVRSNDCGGSPAQPSPRPGGTPPSGPSGSTRPACSRWRACWRPGGTSASGACAAVSSGSAPRTGPRWTGSSPTSTR